VTAIADSPGGRMLHTIAEAAEILHVPEGWLRKKVTSGVVPHTRLGKHVRFTDDHLRQIVVDGEQVPASPLATGESGLSPRARRRGATASAT
jgi:excisionase family DNA binding protein